MATIFDFLKCEVCGKDFNSMTDGGRKTSVDRHGFTHTFCSDCFVKSSEI